MTCSNYILIYVTDFGRIINTPPENSSSSVNWAARYKSANTLRHVEREVGRMCHVDKDDIITVSRGVEEEKTVAGSNGAKKKKEVNKLCGLDEEINCTINHKRIDFKQVRGDLLVAVVSQAFVSIQYRIQTSSVGVSF